MTTKTVTHGSNISSSVATTTLSHTVGSIGDLVVVGIQFESGDTHGQDAGTPITKTGSAWSWTKILDTAPSANSNICRTVFYAAYATDAGSFTFTHTKANANTFNRRMSVWSFNGVTGTLATDIPTGNRIVDSTAGTNTSQAITPAAAGSHIVGGIGDWNQANAFSALTDNTIVNTVNPSGAYTGVWVEPTTNPLSTGSAFTWGANCTGGSTTWAVFEVVAAASTWDPNYDVGGTLSGGNLTFTDTGNASGDGVPSTTGYSSGKYAFSVAVDGGFSAAQILVGVTKDKVVLDGSTADGFGLIYAGGAYYCFSNGAPAAGPDSSSAAPTGSGDVVKVLLDASGSRLYFQVNGNNVLGGNPAAGTGGITIGAGTYYGFLGTLASGNDGTVDFTPGSNPSGFSDWDSVSGGGGGGTDISPAAAQLSLSSVAPSVTNTTPQWYLVGITEAAVDASGDYTLSEPGSVAQNDILVVDIAIRSNVLHTNADWTFPQSDASGNTTNNTTGSIVSYQTGYCIRGGSAPSYVFAKTGGSRCLGTVRAYRSSVAGVPRFDTSAELAMGSAGTALTLTGGVTTAEALELLVTGVFGARANTVSNMDGATEVTGNSGATNTTNNPLLNTWTERSDRNNGTSPTVALACYDVVKETAGSTGDLTATESQSARHGMTVMAFMHPLSSISLQPPAKQLVLSTVAPSVTVSAHRDISPAAAQLTLSAVAPSVSVAAHVNISPAAGQLVFSSAAPAVALSQSVSISPTAAQLVLSSVAPTIARTDNVAIQPGKADLVLSTAAPAVVQTTGVNASPAAAQLSLSTTAPIVAQTTSANLSPAAGQLLLSSAAPSVSVPANVNISPAAGQLVLSRTAPTVIQDVRRDVPAGNLTLTAAAPTVARTDHRDISPAAAQLVLSTTAPGVQAGGSSLLQPSSANLVLTAAAPTVSVTENRNISPAAASLVLSSAAPSVARTDHRNITVGAGQLALSSVAPGVQAGASRNIQPAAANLVFSTAAPTVAVPANVVISPAAAQLSLSSAAPGRVTDVRRDIPQGNLSLSSAAPTVAVSAGRNISPAAGSLTLTGTAPTVSIDFRISPAAAQLVISRSAPAVVQDKPRDVPAGQLAFTSVAPAVGVTGHSFLYPAAAELVLSTYAPAVTIASTEPPRTDRSSRSRQINRSLSQRPAAISQASRPVAPTERRRNVA